MTVTATMKQPGDHGPLMKCGCVAAAVDQDGRPVCPVHFGFAGWDEVADEEPDLSGREAKCRCCQRREPSSLSLAFFEYHPGEAHDFYYCGCRGWD